MTYNRKKADARYNQKRASQERLSGYLTQDESNILAAAIKKSGLNKKKTIIEALRIFLEK